MRRIKESDLNHLVAKLNSITGSNEVYSLDWAYGGVKLVLNDTEDISCAFDTKRNTYNFVLAFLKGYQYCQWDCNK